MSTTASLKIKEVMRSVYYKAATWFMMIKMQTSTIKNSLS